MPNYRTCTHTDDSAQTCNSAAVKGRDFCAFHLNYRGRLLRRAQYRARHQRFDLILPPLDSLCSVQSALCQVAEALAADMIDPRRAQGLLKALRFAKENLRDALKDNAAWRQSLYHSEEPVAYDHFESDYGLPENLDISVPPDVSFPPPPLEPPLAAILSGGGAPSFELSSRAQAALPPESRDPFISHQSSEVPIRDYYAEAEEAMKCHPEDIELEEVMKKYGYKAFDNRAKEHQKNERRRRQRKYFRANYDRFVAEADARNIQRAAEKLYQDRLAADAAGCPIPASVAGVGVVPTSKKPAASVESVPEETKNTA